MARTKVAPHFIVALKCMYKAEIVASRVEKQVRREIEIQSNLRCVSCLLSVFCSGSARGADMADQPPRAALIRHPNILRLYGYFHDEKRIFLMIEFAGKGELYKQLHKLGQFSEKRSSRVRPLY